jgi:short-subunit dehydrogenase
VLFDSAGDTFVTDLAINIGGALVAAQAAAQKMAERGFGTILLTGCGFGLEPNPDYLSLSIGKAGLRALAHGLFESFKGEGIHVATVTVAAVEPGSRNAQAVADLFWQLHSQPANAWTVEAQYTG